MKSSLSSYSFMAVIFMVWSKNLNISCAA